MIHRLPTRRALHEERGQALVELALVAPLLVVLVFGGIEFGRMVNTWAIVTQASREGARVGSAQCSLDPGCGAHVDAAIESSLVGLDVASARWEQDPGPYISGSSLEVRVEYDVIPVVPLIAAFIPGGVLTVQSATTMRLE